MKLGKSDKEFWDSTLKKIFTMVDMYVEERTGNKEEASIEDVL